MIVDTWNIRGSSFHFGRHGMGQENTAVIFSSDRLFSALVARLALLRGAKAVEEFCKPFLDGDPPFLLSSCFPMAGDVRFFPKPLSMQAGNRGPRVKDLKRIRFLSEGVFRSLLNGRHINEVYDPTCLRQKGLLLLDKQDVEGLPDSCQDAAASVWAVKKQARVTLDRSTSASTLFHTARLSFQEGCGLWFGVRWLREPPGMKNLLAGLLAELGDAGLGGERSAGFGACSIMPGGEIELPAPEGRAWITLGRYLPAEDEMGAVQGESAAYRLERVGGWIGSPSGVGQRRRAIQMLVEGSRLAPLPKKVVGRMVDVRPCYPSEPDPLGRPVYRSGITLGVGLGGNIQ